VTVCEGDDDDDLESVVRRGTVLTTSVGTGCHLHQSRL
jgi:hypothetical protein